LAGSDLEQSFSNGIWEFRKDTLILKSGLDKNNIPLLIREYKGEKKDSLSIAWMTNQNDEVVKDVMFFYNDSIQNCMPVFDECRFRSGTIKRIKAVFSNNLYSRWYTIKDAAVTYIEPVLPLDFSLDKYIFLKNKKFLLKKGGLYELKEVKKKIKGKYRSTLIRNTSVFYERSK